MPCRMLRTLLPVMILALTAQVRAQTTVLLTPTLDQGPVGQLFVLTATLDDPKGLCTTGVFQWETDADVFDVINGGFPTEQVAAAWYQAGEKVVSVSYDGCTLPPECDIGAGEGGGAEGG